MHAGMEAVAWRSPAINDVCQDNRFAAGGYIHSTTTSAAQEKTELRKRPMSPSVQNAILNRWASGWTGGKIRKAFGLSRNCVSSVIVEARRRGDFRAIHHEDKHGEIIGRYRHRPYADASAT
jgi:hypothetical protein